jgi:hypothetical protein
MSIAAKHLPLPRRAAMDISALSPFNSSHENGVI